MRKIRIILPVLAFIIAAAGAYASKTSHQVIFYEPNQFKLAGIISCLPCEPYEEDPCTILVQDRRCKCLMVYTPQIAYNSACQALWRAE